MLFVENCFILRSREKNRKWVLFLTKSKYKGVHQRKNGTWYYRIKKTFEDGSVEYYQNSGYSTEVEAHKARIGHLREIAYKEGYPYFDIEEVESKSCRKQQVVDFQSFGQYEYEQKTFHEVFIEFLHSDYVESEASIKKYQALYNAQLAIWANKEIHSFKDTDIDLLLLKISLQGYKATYQASIRKLIKKVFHYANLIDPMVAGDLGVGLSTKPYKLRVLSLFSGIGAPEQALKNMGIDYELVNYSEIDDKVSEAYCLLHGANPEQNLGDIIKVSTDLMERESDRLNYLTYGIEPDKQTYFTIPDFDIMFFGFPSQNISTSGKQQGINGDQSKLFFNAMEIAYMKKPKLMIAENVIALVDNKLKNDFRQVLEEFEDCGYTYYVRKVNANKFGLPQSRDSVFMILIRDDLNINYKFPQGFPLEVNAEDWFETDVAQEYYASDDQIEKIINSKSKKTNFNRDFIPRITTGWGTPSYIHQTFVKDVKGIRCLSSEELMRFQGFTKEQGKMLRDYGFSQKEVGCMVGNSIAVPAIEAFLENLFGQLCKFEKPPVRYDFITDTTEKNREPYIQPLFAYMGNKSKLLKTIIPLMPKELRHMNFVDLFAGTASVGINVDAKRVLINDVSKFLIDIYKGLSCTPPEQGWKRICQIVDKYHLDQDSPEYFNQCRIEYNIKQAYTMPDYWYWGLALVYHSFNRSTVAFNNLGDLNSSYGYEKCDMAIAQRKFFPFAKKMYEGNYEFSNKDFRKAIPTDVEPEETFIYLDPPYWITTAGYNKIWHEEQERALYDYLDEWHKKGFKWMLSNVTHNKKEKNHILLEWIEKHKDEYQVYYLDRNYTACSYNRKKEGQTVEVLITNYKE